MLKLVTNVPFHNDLLDVCKLFFHDWEHADISIYHEEIISNEYQYTVKIGEFIYKCNLSIGQDTSSIIINKRKHLRCNQLSMYRALRKYCCIDMPWGSLTGIRPGKLAYDMIEDGCSYDDIAKNLREEFFLSEDKANLIEQVIINQKDYYVKSENLVNLYIHIPFCTSRCYYCSFVTSTLSQLNKYLAEYVDNLIIEINQAKKTIAENNFQVYSVYIGGGTPTSIPVEQLQRILEAIGNYNVEYTCEAGRPDSITYEKLEVMAKHGVTRISINPQTLHDKTLSIIGRNHTTKEFYDAYNLARQFDFDINIDIIAGLDGEDEADFENTVDGILQISPDNITVHTLCRKRGADLVKSPVMANSSIDQMVDYSIKRITEMGYLPYYLYRQKSMLGNLENVGYCHVAKQCKNNITTMEESLSVIACGAGAISKRIFVDGNRIERFANVKDVKLYNEQFYERMAKKLSDIACNFAKK